MTYTDEHGRIVAPVEPGPLVQVLDFDSFCDDIRFLSSAMGKAPVPPDQMGRWLEAKFKLVSHLPLKRWIEICDVATNTWRFWNEFSADWVQKACAEQARLEQAPPPKAQQGPYTNAPAWFSQWMMDSQFRLENGRLPQDPEDIRQRMRDSGLDPDKTRPEQNQLILARALDGAHKPMPKAPQGMSREEARAAKREVESAWM